MSNLLKDLSHIAIDTLKDTLYSVTEFIFDQKDSDIKQNFNNNQTFHHSYNKFNADFFIPFNSRIARYYGDLELEYGAPLKLVRKAWKKQLLKYHPDHCQHEPEKAKIGIEKTIIINNAYHEIEKYLSALHN